MILWEMIFLSARWTEEVCSDPVLLHKVHVVIQTLLVVLDLMVTRRTELAL